MRGPPTYVSLNDSATTAFATTSKAHYHSWAFALGSLIFISARISGRLSLTASDDRVRSDKSSVSALRGRGPYKATLGPLQLVLHQSSGPSDIAGVILMYYGTSGTGR